MRGAYQALANRRVRWGAETDRDAYRRRDETYANLSIIRTFGSPRRSRAAFTIDRRSAPLRVTGACRPTGSYRMEKRTSGYLSIVRLSLSVEWRPPKQGIGQFVPYLA